MKNIVYKTVLILCLIAGLVLPIGCEKDKGNNDVVLEAFGPCPVLRGNDISFIGSNLDRVTAIVIPGCAEITTITRVSSDEIKVTVPQEATEGQIILKYPEGSITSKSSISFSEEYLISSISPLTPVREGDMITIEGDYLWNMVSVVFMSDAEVASETFESQERKSIVVAVPRDARSGKIKVVDAAGNELYSDQELTIMQPEIASLEPTLIKAGTELTITGTNLDLVEFLTFSGGAVVESTDFTFQSSEEIKLNVPDNCQDGTIFSTAYSQEKFTSEDALEMIVPENIVVNTITRFKAGETIEIEGEELDLVTEVEFSPGIITSDFIYENSSITVTIPQEAIDGEIILHTNSGKSVSTPTIELVIPVIDSFDPVEIVAGEEFEVVGTDLDLVVSLKVGTTACTIIENETTSITVSTPLNTSSGNIVMTLANGVEISSLESLTVNPSTKPTVTSMPESAKPGEEITLLGTNLNNVKGVYFQEVEVTNYVTRDAGKLVFSVPENAPLGSYKLYFEVYEGDDVETDVITIASEVTIYDTEVDLGSWSASFRIYREELAGVNLTAGTIMRLYTTPYSDWPQIQISDSGWAEMVLPQGGEVGEVTDVVLTQDMVDRIMTKEDGWSTTAIIVQGSGVIIHRIAIVLN